jgi:hypothetical protein
MSNVIRERSEWSSNGLGVRGVLSRRPLAGVLELAIAIFGEFAYVLKGKIQRGQVLLGITLFHKRNLT